MTFFLRGILIGLLFGLPVGAVGALTVQRTWNFGAKSGLLTGLGSSAADCLYACVGAFGLNLISDFLLKFQSAITVAGGVLILLMGLKSLLYPQTEAPSDKTNGAIALFLSSFAVGITNPAAILTFLFAFSYFGISQIDSFLNALLLVVGVLVGTYFWWGTLTLLTVIFKKKTNKFKLSALNRAFGLILCFFAAAVFLRVI